jgi:hypothetical protein
MKQPNKLRKTLHILFWVTIITIAFYAFVQNFNKGYDNSIHNPANQPYILEVAFNLGIHVDSVTQEQFNQRYLK